MSKPTIACVITTYNYGQFLNQAIDSVLAQTHPVDQLIIIDDGSTDNSADIAAAYGSKLTLISQSNAGVVVARNTGAAHVTTDYLFFLDADDYLHPDYVNLLLTALASAASANPYLAIAYADQQLVGNNQALITANSWNPRKLLYRNYLSISSIVSKAAFDSVGGFAIEENRPTSFEDWDFWLSLLEKGWQGVYVNQPLFYYRIHGAGRNGQALQQRQELEKELHHRHPQLYRSWSNRLYLAVFATASRIRNLIKRPPGT